MHHKRGRPKHQRMGCDCKYWKDERYPKAARAPATEQRRLQADDGDVTMEEAYAEVVEERSIAEIIHDEIDRGFAEALGMTYVNYLKEI